MPRRYAVTVRKYQNWYAENSEKMLEFAHSSHRSIHRDIENEHLITPGLTDVTAVKTQRL